MSTGPALAATVPTASSVMHTPVFSVDAATSLTALWHLMQRLHLEAVVVSDGRVPLGVVDRRDIWATWASDLGARVTGTARGVVGPSPCVSPTTSLPQVCAALLRAHHETVMVLDEQGHLRGIVTAADVLHVGESR
jgi:predicted transcriptional regulator